MKNWFAAWRRTPSAAPPLAWLDTPLAQQSWVVVDVESTGLDTARDQVLAIGAVLIDAQGIDLGRCFSCTLRRPVPANAQVLLHGLAPQALTQGIEPAQALSAFLEFIGEQPLLAFHAPFDRALLERALRKDLQRTVQLPVLDLAELAPLVLPDVPLRAELDSWLAHFGLTASQRHSALADALASAELALILLHHARRQGYADARALQDACARLRRRAHSLPW